MASFKRKVAIAWIGKHFLGAVAVKLDVWQVTGKLKIKPRQEDISCSAEPLPDQGTLSAFCQYPIGSSAISYYRVVKHKYIHH